VPKRLGTWNPTRGLWETDRMDLLSEHSEPYSATWPTSGMTHAGVAYELPMPALPTAATASSSSRALPTPTSTNSHGNGANGRGEPLLPAIATSLLPTPQVADVTGGHKSRSGVRSNELLLPGVAEQLTLLKTPTAQLAVNGGSQHPEKRKAGGHGPTLADELEHLLPIPSASDAATKAGCTMQTDSAPDADPTRSAPTRNGAVPLLPTPSAAVVNDGESPETWTARRARVKATGVNGNGMGMPLTIAAQLLAPGATTPPPSSAGSPPSAA